jgi:hypothetical protein
MRPNRIYLAMATALALVLGLFTSASATVVRKRSFNDLTRDSQMIAVGRVESVESHPTSDHLYAYTYVTVGELDVLKGTYREPSIALRMAGGPLGDGRVLHVADIPQFQPGEKVVLFVTGNGRNLCPLVGWGQGLLRVETDAGIGREIVKTSDGLEISGIARGDFVIRAIPGSAEPEGSAGSPDEPAAQHTPTEKASGGEGHMTLDDLKQRVRGLLAKSGTSAKAAEEVRSAGIALSSPGARTPKAMRGRN